MNKVQIKSENGSFSKSKSFTEKQLIQMIKEAEKGPFYTSSEIKERLKNWKTKRA